MVVKMRMKITSDQAAGVGGANKHDEESSTK